MQRNPTNTNHTHETDRDVSNGGEVTILRDEMEYRTALGRSDRVCIFFTASWSQPCKTMTSILENVRPQHPGTTFYVVDVVNNQKVSKMEHVDAIPMFKFYYKGKSIDSFSGADEAALKSSLGDLEKASLSSNNDERTQINR